MKDINVGDELAMETLLLEAFISKIIDECTDASVFKIKKAIAEKNNKSIESQIYNITVELLTHLSGSKYRKDSDEIYNDAEELLKFLKNQNRDYTYKSRISLNDDEIERFKIAFCEEISKEKYKELYAVLLIWSKSVRGPDEGLLNQIDKKLDKLLLHQQDTDLNIKIEHPTKSRTKEYAEKWNQNLFLNDFDEQDENPGVNIKLNDVYKLSLVPQYIWKNEPKISRHPLNECLEKYIYKKNKNNEMLLIFGQPGIGKSTLITWIVNHYPDKFDNILVYQFAADLRSIDWKNEDIFDQILKQLNISIFNLNDKIIILDGFDEIYVGDNRREILNNIYWYLQSKSNIINNFSVIITCRENYLTDITRLRCEYLTLLPWGQQQIEDFCEAYESKSNYKITKETKNRIIANKQILGIPLILYMILALNVPIVEKGSIVDIFDRIFSLEDDGIYDRCLYGQPHRIGRIKDQIHQITRKIAIWIFENNAEEAFIPQTEYIKICDEVAKLQTDRNEDIENDFLIGNYFKLIKHCEGSETQRLLFVHRSIYEYFVAETIYNSIQKALNIFLSDNEKSFSVEGYTEFAGGIAVYLRKGDFNANISSYFTHKMLSFYRNIPKEKREYFFPWLEKAVEIMLENGMFYAASQIGYANIINKELHCFVNLLEILRNLHTISNTKYILSECPRGFLGRYIRCSNIFPNEYVKNKINYLNLSRLDLSNENLSGLLLVKANFEGTNLENADLTGADLTNANFKNSNLEHASFESARLISADLFNVNLCNAHLPYANLTSANLKGAKLKRALLTETILCSAELSDACLIESNLSGAYLENTNLKGANLTNANLCRAILVGAKLSYAVFSETVLTGMVIGEKQVKYFEGEYDLRDIYVYVDEAMISYQEYSYEKNSVVQN